MGGSVFTLVGVGVLTFLVFNFARSAFVWRSIPRERLSTLGPAVIILVLLLTGVAAYGVSLMVRGIRGRSRRRFVSANAWYFRHWYAFGLIWWGALAGVAMLLAGGPAAFFWGRGDAVLRWAWYGFLVFLVLPLHVTAHELGHAAVGALLGFRFAVLRVGRLVVHRDGKRYRVDWSPASIAGVLGLHLGVPEGDDALGARFAIYAICGPITTLTLAATCRIGAAALEPASMVSSIATSHALLVGWWVGVFFGVLNVLPFRLRSGFVTDGGHLLSIVFSKSPAAKAMLRYQLFSTQGRRPRDWGMSVESLLSAAEGDRRYGDTLRMAALSVALDYGDSVHVDEILHRVVAVPPSRNMLVRHEFELQTAMVEALRGNVSGAKERFGRLGPHPLFPDYPKLAEAVINLAEGRFAEARAALETWKRALAKTGMATALRVGNEWAEEALLARLTNPP